VSDRYVCVEPAPAPPGAPRHLIVNADDFGASRGVNRGIVDAHRRGIVTSASLTVTGRALEDAVALSREHPGLHVGLHFDVWGEDERTFDTRDLAATRDELLRQLDRFAASMGRPPTHVDSHRHAHRERHLFESFREWVAPLGVPLRCDGRVRFVGGFYAQWEWQVSDLAHVSVERLQEILREEVPPGWTELSCHPGLVDPEEGYRAVYLREREAELATLTDPRIRQTVEALGIRLAGYGDVPPSPPIAGAAR
jgi:predicted glycoside hydrolase/deacetylase ChbG (UPF0249 family)